MADTTTREYQSFGEFFPHYLREHAEPRTRYLHYVGTALVIGIWVWALLALNAWLILLTPLAGYGFAWAAHAFVERNRPATFTYPWWSFLSDFKMFGLAMTGRLRPHLERAGVAASAA